MELVRSLCEWFGFPKDFISKLFNRAFPKMKDAIIEGDIDKVEEYYSMKYPICGQDQNILHIALQNNQIEMAKYILDNVESIRIQDKNQDGDTPLMLATLANNLNLVKKLVEKGAPLNSRENEGATPFIAAAANGFIDILEYLLAQGANPYIRNFSGETALHRACYYGKMSVVLFLIDKSNGPGLKLCKRDRAGNNCLHSAAQGLSINCLRYFNLVIQRSDLFQQRNEMNERVYDILERQFNIIRDQDFKKISQDQIIRHMKDKNFPLNVTSKKNMSRIFSNRSGTNHIIE